MKSYQCVALGKHISEHSKSKIIKLSIVWNYKKKKKKKSESKISFELVNIVKSIIIKMLRPKQQILL